MKQHIVEGGCTQRSFGFGGMFPRRKRTKQDMKRLSASARVAITFNPLRASWCQSVGNGSRRNKFSKLPATDLMGASELFNS